MFGIFTLSSILPILTTGFFLGSHKNKTQQPLQCTVGQAATTTMVDIFFNGNQESAHRSISETFSEFDVDKNGAISVDEIAKVRASGVLLNTSDSIASIAIGQLKRFADENGDQKVTLDEFMKNSDALLESKVEYCPEKCHQLETRLNECGIRQDGTEPIQKQMRFMMQMCRMNSLFSHGWEKCLFKNPCEMVNQCFQSVSVTDGEHLTFMISSYLESIPFGFLHKHAHSNVTFEERVKMNITETISKIHRKSKAALVLMGLSIVTNFFLAAIIALTLSSTIGIAASAFAITSAIGVFIFSIELMEDGKRFLNVNGPPAPVFHS